MILQFRETDGKTGNRLTLGESAIPDGSTLVRSGRHITGSTGGAPHAPVTVVDTSSIDLTIAGQQLTADLKAAFTDALYLKLDQTAPQTVVNGTPTFNLGLSITTTGKTQYRDSAIYINSINDGYLDFTADTGFRFNTGSVTIGSMNSAGFVKNNAAGLLSGGNSIIASDVLIPNGIGTPTYDDMQDYLNMCQSEGRLTGGTITAKAPADGSINISELEGVIHTVNTLGNPLIYFKKAASNLATLTDLSVNFIIATYSGGNIVYSASTSRPADNTYNAFVIGRCFRSGTDVEVLTTGQNIYDMYGRAHDRLLTKYGNMDHATGAIVSAHATPLRLSCTAGVWYFGNTPINTDAKDTFQVWYRTGGGAWTESTTKTLFSEVFDGGTSTVYETYQNGTSLAALTANKYGVFWIFVCPEQTDPLYVVLGTDKYSTIGAAQAASVPASLPPYCVNWSRLVGKVIIKNGDTSFFSVESVFDNKFTLSAATDHASLANLPWSLSGHNGLTAGTIAKGGALGIGLADSIMTDSGTGTIGISYAGTVTSNHNIMSITNTANAASMTNTTTSILFNQYYYDASTPAIADIGYLRFGTLTNWNSNVNTQDGYFSVGVAVDGTLNEYFRVENSAVKFLDSYAAFYNGSTLSGRISSMTKFSGSGDNLTLQSGSGLGINFCVNNASTIALGILSTGDVEIGSTKYFGLGAAKGSLVFTDSTNDDITVSNAILRIGSGTLNAWKTATYNVFTTGKSSAILGTIATDELDIVTGGYYSSVDSKWYVLSGGYLERYYQYDRYHYFQTAVGIPEAGEASFTTSLRIGDVDIVSYLPTYITTSATVKTNLNALIITNTVNADDMDGTTTSIAFNQWYYDASTPAIADIGYLRFGTETDWTSTASTQNGYFSIGVALGGTVTERLRINSTGNVLIPADSLGLVLGVGQDSSIYYDGTNTYFKSLVGTGAWVFDASLSVDTDARINIYAGEAKDSILQLSCDEGDDNADLWRMINTASDNIISIDSYASGGWVRKLSIDTTGGITSSYGKFAINTSGGLYHYDIIAGGSDDTPTFFGQSTYGLNFCVNGSATKVFYIESDGGVFAPNILSQGNDFARPKTGYQYLFWNESTKEIERSGEPA